MYKHPDEWFTSFTTKVSNPNVDQSKDQVPPFVLSTVASPKMFVSVQRSPENNVLGNQHPENDLGVLIATPVGKEGKFLLSAKGRPSWYMYAKDNNVEVCNGDPGEMGHWDIEVISVTKPKATIMLKTGDSMYAFMQSEDDYNVMCSTSEPGDNGHFIAEYPQLPK